MSVSVPHQLKSGFTTGAAAAAAVKGALYLMFTGRPPETVRIDFIGGGHRWIDIDTCRMEGEKTVCSVIKDAGDDPDVTHKAEIGVVVTRLGQGDEATLQFVGGRGVGRVTKPGLDIPVGDPAITPGPRKMIQTAVEQVLAELHRAPVSLQVELFVPLGEQLAQRTLNARLGIVGGISILGTTGIVRPLSHDAYIATIRSAMSVASAGGVKTVFLTTGRRSERFAQQIWPREPAEAFIQIGDFFQTALELAVQAGFEQLVLLAFFGKALKMAQGVPHTHAAKSDLCLRQLTQWMRQTTQDQLMVQAVAQANTARQAFLLLKDDYPQVIAQVGREMFRSANKFIHSHDDCPSRPMKIRAVIMDFEGRMVFDSHHSHLVSQGQPA